MPYATFRIVAAKVLPSRDSFRTRFTFLRLGTLYLQSNVLFELGRRFQQLAEETAGDSDLHMSVRAERARMKVLPECAPAIFPLGSIRHEAECLAEGTPMPCNQGRVGLVRAGGTHKTIEGLSTLSDVFAARFSRNSVMTAGLSKMRLCCPSLRK